MVRLSHTVLSLAPACLGDTVTTSVFLSNVSAVEQVFRCAGKIQTGMFALHSEEQYRRIVLITTRE